MKKRYTHVFFDLDNTLWDFRKNSRLAMKAAFEKHISVNGRSVEYEDFFEIYTKINHTLWEDYRKQQVSKKELVWLRFQKTFDALQIKNANPEAMNNTYLAAMPLQTSLIPGAAEIVSYLKGKNYNLNIISNGFREVQYKKLENTGLLTYFNKVFLSEDVKVPKPGAEMFAYSLQSVNARKSASIMIGDDWEVDILGAVNYGIDAVYLRQENPIAFINEKVIEKKVRVITVNELTELKNIL